jgi:hypothetical protein
LTGIAFIKYNKSSKTPPAHRASGVRRPTDAAPKNSSWGQSGKHHKKKLLTALSFAATLRPARERKRGQDTGREFLEATTNSRIFLTLLCLGQKLPSAKRGMENAALFLFGKHVI